MRNTLLSSFTPCSLCKKILLKSIKEKKNQRENPALFYPITRCTPFKKIYAANSLIFDDFPFLTGFKLLLSSGKSSTCNSMRRVISVNEESRCTV